MANILTFPLSLVLNGQAGTDFGVAIDLDGSEVTGILPNSKTTAASANTASAIVTRDASGNFAAGTITAALTGTASGNLVSGGAGGTPSSITLTNGTGLPIAGITASTSTALGVGSIELGHASDTTITRVSAGVVAVEGTTIATLGANTFIGDQTLSENVGIVLDAVLSADGKYSGIVEAGTSAAALAFGELCYRVTATGKWALAKFDAAATCTNELGICVLAAAGADAATTMLLFGKVRADALYDTFTVGAPLYGSAATAGKIVSTAPTGTVDFVVLQVGKAEDANTIFFNPSRAPVTIDESSKVKTVSGVAVASASVGNHCVALFGGNGWGSTNTCIRRHVSVETNVGTALTYADSAANGETITVNEAGLYEVYVRDYITAGAFSAGASLNSSQLSTGIASITAADIIVTQETPVNTQATATRTIYCAVNDVIRPHGDGQAGTGNTVRCFFSVRKVN